jgi:cyclopropane-fatty-acyl-phospholipid synthase
MALRQLPDPRPGAGPITGAAAAVQPLVEALLGDPPLRIELWDGTGIGPHDGAGLISVRSPDALRRILWAPDELGLGRAYVAGDLDVDGDIVEMVRALRPAGVALQSGLRVVPAAMAAARRLNLLAPPPAPPPEEARPRGWRHSKSRDAQAISHHYDVSNEFYEILLGSAMTYSCARFTADGMSLLDAQAAKHELICRKLGLHERPGMKLLDVGCGWASMAMHAAAHHDAKVVGITISNEQAHLAARRVKEAGLEDHVEIRLQDYRDLAGERFDAISSIGMFEHVGKTRMREYFETLRAALHDRGRFLNHAISSAGGSTLGRRSFMARYVFPDAELLDVGDVVLAMEAAGFEVRDIESLREHYALTLRHWIANLEQHWDDAVGLVGGARARVWRLYMAGSAVGFEDGGVGLHQVLGVALDADGGSGMPPTRDGWVG